LPVRVDDVPFSDFNANIARKNVIDFKAGWAPALARVFQVLERDGVPKGAIAPADVAAWCLRRSDADQMPRIEPEQLYSNWLPIAALPPQVSLFSLGVAETAVSSVMSGTRLPWFKYFRLVGTFGTEVDLKLALPEQVIERRYTLTREDMLAGMPAAMPGVKRADARRMVVNLLRQSWNNAMQAKGLSAFEMADNSVAWFFTKDLIEKDTAYFVDHTGKRRRKAMVGRSEKRGVYWHLGFIAKPVMTDTPHFVMKAAIIFSHDGKTPLDSVEKMHTRLCDPRQAEGGGGGHRTPRADGRERLAHSQRKRAGRQSPASGPAVRQPLPARRRCAEARICPAFACGLAVSIRRCLGAESDPARRRCCGRPG